MLNLNISEFKSIPKFINMYIDNGESRLESITHDFCKALIDIESLSIKSHPYRNFYIVKINDDALLKITSEFVDFYFEKSRLNRKLQCAYEDELGLPNSLANEEFEVMLGDKSKKIVIESFDIDKHELVLEEIR